MANEGKVKLQGLKFVIFECSAGVIQFLSFTLMKWLVNSVPFFINLQNTNEKFAALIENEYGPMYLIALFLSVCWSFTFNRKVTFKSASNVPIAMLMVLGYYAVFTPISTIIGNHITANNVITIAGSTDLIIGSSNLGPTIDFVVLIVTMLCNMVTEFIWEKYFVFRDALHRGEEQTLEEELPENYVPRGEEKDTSEKIATEIANELIDEAESK